jgi:hypothetical protein
MIHQGISAVLFSLADIQITQLFAFLVLGAIDKRIVLALPV